MAENNNNKEIDAQKKDEEEKENDMEAYFSEIKSLETDFSDLNNFDLEELKEIQEAISKVKEMESSPDKKVSDLDYNNQLKIEESQNNKTEINNYKAQREAMAADFSDLEDIEFEELKEMQEAIDSVKKEELGVSSKEIGQEKIKPDLSTQLEERIKEELLERRVEEKKEIVTPEKFLEYIKEKRDKIWYHCLYYLVFQTEDYTASKELLYDMLKEHTSKSPIDPIPEHQFYFGLGYIFRLTLNDKQIVRFLSRGKLKINVGVKMLKELLEQAGEPIITKPILAEEEKKEMYREFLEDDFKDI